MAMTYQERKAQGKRKSAEHERRVHRAKDLAIVFRGAGAGFGFMFVMGIVSNVNRLLEVVFLIGYALVIFLSLVFAEHIVFTAEQNRYPKSHRRTVRREIAEAWQRFRNKKS